MITLVGKVTYKMITLVGKVTYKMITSTTGFSKKENRKEKKKER